jgi:hypothetical protein
VTATSSNRYLGYTALGMAGTLGVTGLLPLGVTLVCVGIALVLLLPHHPRAVAVLCVGAFLVLATLVVVWTTGWGCASEVDGRIVEHDCGEPPAGQ